MLKMRRLRGKEAEQLAQCFTAYNCLVEPEFKARHFGSYIVS